MKYTLQNYKFFKSYRFPIKSEDKVQAEVVTFERENVRTNNVQLESINLSGLNFICGHKYTVGEKIKLNITTDRLFNNWNFELQGTIIRSFICCADVTKTIYGLAISDESEIDVLKYFLKDFINQFSTAQLKEKLYKICQNKIEVNKDDAVELFSLFHNLVDKTYKSDKSDILKDLLKIFHCENYHILTYEEEKGNFLNQKSNSNLDLSSSMNHALFHEVYFNKILINKSFNTQSATGVELKIRNMLMSPLINASGDCVGILCLTNSISGEKFNQTMIDNIKIVSGLISQYYSDYARRATETQATEFSDHYIFSDRTPTGLAISQYLSTIKNTKENIYIRGSESTLKNVYIKYLSSKKHDTIYVDFEDAKEHSFEFLKNIDENHITDIIISNIHMLSIERQSSLYNVISALSIRIITTSEIDLKGLTKNGLLVKDLYNLLSVIKLNIPPLSQRRNEIVDIANYYMTYELEKRAMNTKFLTSKTTDILNSKHLEITHEQLHSKILKAILKSENEDKSIELEIDNPVIELSISSDKNLKLQEHIVEILKDSDNNLSYSKLEKLFVSNLFTKKAS